MKKAKAAVKLKKAKAKASKAAKAKADKIAKAKAKLGGKTTRGGKKTGSNGTDAHVLARGGLGGATEGVAKPHSSSRLAKLEDAEDREARECTQ